MQILVNYKEVARASWDRFIDPKKDTTEQEKDILGNLSKSKGKVLLSDRELN